MSHGEELRSLRLRRRLTMRDVEAETAKIAFRFSDKRYLVQRSHLSSYERQRSTPSLYKFFSLLSVYHCTPGRLMASFGIPGRSGGKAPVTVKASTWTRPSAPLVMLLSAQKSGSRRRLADR